MICLIKHDPLHAALALAAHAQIKTWLNNCLFYRNPCDRRSTFQCTTKRLEQHSCRSSTRSPTIESTLSGSSGPRAGSNHFRAACGRSEKYRISLTGSCSNSWKMSSIPALSPPVLCKLGRSSDRLYQISWTNYRVLSQTSEIQRDKHVRLWAGISNRRAFANPVGGLLERVVDKFQNFASSWTVVATLVPHPDGQRVKIS